MVRRGEGTSRFRIIRRADSGVRCSQARRSSIRVDRLPERVCRISIRRCPRRDRVMSVVDAVVRSGRDFVEPGRERGSRRVDPVSMQHRRRSAPENFFLKGRSSPENSVFDDVTGYGQVNASGRYRVRIAMRSLPGSSLGNGSGDHPYKRVCIEVRAGVATGHRSDFFRSCNGLLRGVG